MLLSNSSMFWPFSGHVFRSILPEIRQEFVRITSLSCVLSIQVPWGFFRVLNPFMYLKAHFKQQKISLAKKVITRFRRKSQNVEPSNRQKNIII